MTLKHGLAMGYLLECRNYDLQRLLKVSPQSMSWPSRHETNHLALVLLATPKPLYMVSDADHQADLSSCPGV